MLGFGVLTGLRRRGTVGRMSPLRTALVCSLVAAVCQPMLACTEVMDAINAGQDEAASNDENRRRFHENRAAGRRGRATRGAKQAEKKVVQPEPIVELDPNSPEGQLFAEIERRLACVTESCRAQGLQRVRDRSASLLPGLPRLFTGQREKVTLEALKLAGLFRDKASLGAVGKVAMIGTRGVRTEAVWALGAIGDERGLDSLNRLARIDVPAWLGGQVCRAVGQIRSEKGVEAIEKVFNQGQPAVRAECVQAAGRLPGKRARALVERAAKDPRAQVADEARRVLARMSAKKPAVTP